MSDVKSLVARLTAHRALLLILALFSLLTLYNSALLPLGEASDETDHYQYLRFVARTGHPPLTETERNEAGFKGGLAPLYYWLTAWPIALVGEDAPPDIRRVDSRPERHIPTDGLGINHVLHTLDEQWPWRGQVLAWHLVRLLSLPLGWVTIIATYALVRRLLPESRFIALGAAAFVAFLPRFVISSAVINDDNLVFALTALLLLTQVMILQGDHRRLTFAIFGALLGLALVTKYFSLILIPEVLFTLFIFSRSVGNSQRVSSTWSRLAAFLVALLLTAGPWFTFIIVRFNRIGELGFIPGLAASLGEPQITEGLVGLLSGQAVRPPAATYTLPEWFSLLYRSFWFEYGWMRIFAPAWIYGLFTLFGLLVLGGLIYGVWRSGRFDEGRIPVRAQATKGEGPTTHAQQQSGAGYLNRQSPIPNHYLLITNLQHLHGAQAQVSPLFWLLALHLALFVIVVLARYLLSATIDTGQGRHLYPALPVIALLIALGLSNLRSTIYDLVRSLPVGRFAILRPGSGQVYDPSTWLRTGLRFGKQLTPRRGNSRLPASGNLLAATCFLLPALLSLIPAIFILPHYRMLPVTITPPGDLAITYRAPAQFAEGLAFEGFDVAGTVSAGEALPVTLYWRAEREAQQDYLLSVCLQNEAAQAVACWRGHFADGHYPARAWAVGDTLIDTVYVPIPACEGIHNQTYNLHLALWPLALDSPRPVAEEAPVWQQTFPDPPITIQAGDRPSVSPQTTDVWQASQRLTGPTELEPNEALTLISYRPNAEPARPVFEAGGQTWAPLPQFDTPLSLPCEQESASLARLTHFIADPTLPPGAYRLQESELTISLATRLRALQPLQSGLSFDPYLSPLTLAYPSQPPIELTALAELAPAPSAPVPTITHDAALPITIRWQARQWMAEPLVVSLKLLDKEFMIGGERIASLGDRYPNVLWIPTEIVEESYPLRIKPDAPPGLYRLELSLIHQNQALPDGFEYLPLTNQEASLGTNLYPVTVRLLDPAHARPPSQPLSAQLGDAVQLTGYDLNQSLSSNPESPISLTLYWQANARLTTDYTVFTQLLGPDGQVWAQWDNPPQAGRYPTSAWVKDDTIADRYRLNLRDGAPAGEYRLLVGMYDPATGRQLPVRMNDQPQPNQAIELARVVIDP